MEAKKRLRDFVLIFIGSSVTAFAVKYIFDPAGMVTGGVSGLAIIVRTLSARAGMEVPLWLSNVLLNVPVFLFAWRMLGFKSLLRTGLSWIIVSAELYVFRDAVLIAPEDLLLACIYGGICFGAGTGMLMMADASSGGSDLLAMALARVPALRHISMGRLMQVLDGAVVAAGALVFGIEHTLYAVISVFLMGKVIDMVLSIGRTAKIALIISACPDEIAEDILTRLDRGVTRMEAVGGYSGERREVLVCVCTKRDIVRLKDIVRRHDPRAFCVVGDVGEALGEGFAEE